MNYYNFMYHYHDAFYDNVIDRAYFYQPDLEQFIIYCFAWNEL